MTRGDADYYRRSAPIAEETLAAIKRAAHRSASIRVLLQDREYLLRYIQERHDAQARGETPSWAVPYRERIGE